MAGSATVTGKQHYIGGIGHPATEAAKEAPPAMVVTNDDGVSIGLVGALGEDILQNSGPNLSRETTAPARVRKAIYAAIESGGYIACLGDSTIAPWPDFSYSYGFSSSLSRAIGEIASKYCTPSQGIVGPVAGNNATTSIWNLTGSSVASLYASPMAFVTAATVTPPQLGTAMRVIYGNTGGNSTIAIDGGAADPMPRTGTNTPAVYTKTGLTYGTHTGALVKTSGTDFHIIGAHVYNPGEPAILNFGAGGANTSNLYQPAMWYSAYALIKTLAAKVCFIRCGTNDINQGTTQSITVNNMMLIAAGMVASNVLPVFLPLVPISGKDAERASLWTAVKAACDAAGYAYADYGDLYFGKTYAEAVSAGIMLDTVHLNGAGQQRETGALKRWLNM